MHSAQEKGGLQEADDPPDAGLRMRDIVRETGLPRETIHFYLAEGLLPPATKKGRNTALYSWEHVRRARLVKSIQDKHFLPLRAIRALLEDADDSSMSAPQRALIAELRIRLNPLTAIQNLQRVPVRDLAERHGLSTKEIREFHSAGLMNITGTGVAASVTREDAELVDAWVRLRTAGISPERGFMPRDFELIDESVAHLVRREIDLFTERYASVGADEAARVLTDVVPILNQIIGIVHWRKMRTFLADVSEQNPAQKRAVQPRKKKKR